MSEDTRNFDPVEDEGVTAGNVCRSMGSGGGGMVYRLPVTANGIPSNYASANVVLHADSEVVAQTSANVAGN